MSDPGDAFERMMQQIFANAKYESVDKFMADPIVDPWTAFKAEQPLHIEFDQEIPTHKDFDYRAFRFNKLAGLPAAGTYSHCYKHGSDVAVFYDCPTRTRNLSKYSYWCNVCLILIQGLYQPVGSERVLGGTRTSFMWIEHGLTMGALLDTRFSPDEIYERVWYELAKSWTSKGLVPTNMACLRGEEL